MITRIGYKTFSCNFQPYLILIFFIIYYHKKGKIHNANKYIDDKTIFNESITKSNEKKNCYKKETMGVLKNAISFFCFIFLSMKKFIL